MLHKKVNSQSSKFFFNLFSGLLITFETKICHDKDLSSNCENEGGAGGNKRKQAEGLEHLPVQKSKKSRRTIMEAANYGGKNDSGTLRPNVLGGNSFCGREPDTRRQTRVGFNEKEGGTIRGAKTRRDDSNK